MWHIRMYLHQYTFTFPCIHMYIIYIDGAVQMNYASFHFVSCCHLADPATPVQMQDFAHVWYIKEVQPPTRSVDHPTWFCFNSLEPITIYICEFLSAYIHFKTNINQHQPAPVLWPTMADDASERRWPLKYLKSLNQQQARKKTVFGWSSRFSLWSLKPAAKGPSNSKTFVSWEPNFKNSERSGKLVVGKCWDMIGHIEHIGQTPAVFRIFMDFLIFFDTLGPLGRTSATKLV